MHLFFGSSSRTMTSFCCCCDSYPLSDGESVVDDDAVGLSHVGMAAYDCLRKRHNRQHHKLWNVTSGAVVGELHQTPRAEYAFRLDQDPPVGHDDWFPAKIGEIMARTERWCDLMSLGPPDGLFLEHIQSALKTICQRAQTTGNKVKVRMMFGNIVGMPVNCNAVIRTLTQGLPSNPNLQLWVGAWRKGVSWNHAKIIAVDGMWLHTGGHNLWDQHYLRHHPVNDLSLELKVRTCNDKSYTMTHASRHLIVSHCNNRVASPMMGTCSPTISGISSRVFNPPVADSWSTRSRMVSPWSLVLA